MLLRRLFGLVKDPVTVPGAFKQMVILRTPRMVTAIFVMKTIGRERTLFSFSGRLRSLPGGSVWKLVDAAVRATGACDEEKDTRDLRTLSCFLNSPSLPDSSAFRVRLSKASADALMRESIIIPKERDTLRSSVEGAVATDLFPNRRGMPSRPAPVFSKAKDFPEDDAADFSMERRLRHGSTQLADSWSDDGR